MSDRNLRPQAGEPVERGSKLALEVIDCSVAPLSVGSCGFCCFSFADDEG